MENKTAISPARSSLASFHHGSGQEIQAVLLHFTAFRAAFEFYAPTDTLRTSEVLDDFKIILNDREVYSGRAVVSNFINAGDVMVCEVTLESYWVNLTPPLSPGEVRPPVELGEFLRQWQTVYKVLPEFKVVVADMRSLFSEMRLWLDRKELEIHSSANGHAEQIEKETAGGLAASALSVIDTLGDRFEEIAGRLDPDQRPAHIHFTRRNLHSHLLCSPFAYRTYHKPLGYAGDYGMVNMILLDPFQGSSLYAKLINAWFLNQLPAQAHRNRIKFLKRKLTEETLRVAGRKRPVEVFNLGCGPAHELQEWLGESELSDRVRFTLLDFNEETIRYAQQTLTNCAARSHRQTAFQWQKKTVQQLLKETMRQEKSPADGKFDFLYCAGLFDYLPDSVCKQLVGVFYKWLAPGGLLLVTNVDGSRPFRNKLEFILDWNLIYRNAQQLFSFKPEDAPADACSVQADVTSVNVFMQVRKPENG